MSSFPNSPKLVKGGLVLVDQRAGLVGHWTFESGSFFNALEE